LRVCQGRFGYGTIAVVEERQALEVDFEHAGRKRVLGGFVSLG
jgi:DNA helicase II / ATP-dependent DNA helicase PcrA